MRIAFLILVVGDTRLALPISEVREILPMLPIERPPGLPRPLVGFASVRGEALPVVAPLLLLDPDADMGPIDLFAHIVRPHGEARATPCLLVDRVEDVVEAAKDTLLPVDPARSLNGAITGELPLPNGTAHVVWLPTLLADAERSALARLTRQAQSRLTDWATA